MAKVSHGRPPTSCAHWAGGSTARGCGRGSSTAHSPDKRGGQAVCASRVSAPDPDTAEMRAVWAAPGVGLLLWLSVSGTPVDDNRATCLLPPDDGPCRALLLRYYYDRHTQTCEEFSYGGCDGNDNNFETLDDCESSCWKIKKVPKICRLEADEGPCRALFKRYFFNLNSMKCEVFYYGGCYGNDNIFKDESSCMQYCLPKHNSPSFCYSPKEEGSCSASVTRYYFNPERKACEEFVYTGCGGNSNNFVSLRHCDNVCIKGSKKPKMQSAFRGWRLATPQKVPTENAAR